MAEFFIRIWHALTAAGRSFALGGVEAWGFWSTTLLLLVTVLFIANMLNGIVWRMIEGRLRPRMRDQEAAARLLQTILELKADLLDSERERARLAEVSAEQERVIEANRNWARNWNADAGRVKAGAR